jgi:predicted phage terminase large subunit-like protein
LNLQSRRDLLELPEYALDLMTDEEQQLYLRALELHHQTYSPLDYMVTVSGAERYPHIVMLNDWVMALMEGRLYFDGPGPMPEAGVHPERGDRPVYNLAISMPPRHGKSFLVSEHMPAWFLSNFPDYGFALASYEANFAADWGGKARDHIVDHPEFGIEVDGGRNASKSYWKLLGHRGFMRCVGAGGPLTGTGAQAIVVDDPIKNAEEAMSAIERENNDNWWNSTLYTRREPWADGTPCRVILMSTRWHEDDIHGRRIPRPPEAGDQWAQINLPAIAQEDDPLGRAPGEALCPERVPLEELLLIKEQVGDLWFEAMYQGSPSLAEGNLIKRPFNYYDTELSTYQLTDRDGKTTYYAQEDCYRFATLDVAGVAKAGNDFTVLAVWDVPRDTEGPPLILHSVRRIRLDTEHHEAEVLKWYSDYDLRAIHVEDKTFGTNLIGRLNRHPNLVVMKLKADTNKVIRAMPVGYEVLNGNLWFPRNAEWLSELESELTKFPNSSHDDQVDTVAYGVQVYKSLPNFTKFKRKPKPERGTMEEMTAHRKKLVKQAKRRAPRSILGRW